jgi:hypothetical protein
MWAADLTARHVRRRRGELVADETDFIDLYGKLRLDPGCSLEDFKRAYRRNVSMWHPDRRRGSRADMLAAARLQRLTAQYGAAMDFHRRHGRLPGAPIRIREVEAVPVEAVPVEPVVVAPTPRLVSTPHRSHARHWWLAALALGGAVVAWSLWPAEAPPEAEARQAPVPVVEEEAAEVPMLTLGMTPEEVLAIEGEPLRRGEGRWEYGPSWVRFEQGSLVDWYSSPLRALRVTSTRPRP